MDIKLKLLIIELVKEAIELEQPIHGYVFMSLACEDVHYSEDLTQLVDETVKELKGR